jgi:hypothetical protein
VDGAGDEGANGAGDEGANGAGDEGAHGAADGRATGALDEGANGTELGMDAADHEDGTAREAGLDVAGNEGADGSMEFFIGKHLLSVFPPPNALWAEGYRAAGSQPAPGRAHEQ